MQLLLTVLHSNLAKHSENKTGEAEKLVRLHRGTKVADLDTTNLIRTQQSFPGEHLREFCLNQENCSAE